ncbi:uncharacterized protein [Montipora capricornis]|uniref:uncharacterized protein n=1 Tax=Montipora capricornis TaxID=246305 RepID=UPI0035F2173D
MADSCKVQNKKQSSNTGMLQNTASLSSQYSSASSSLSFRQQGTPFSQTQQPWTVLWYWMHSQYYQHYYHQLCSYMHYWQAVASLSMYQGAFLPQSGTNQASQTVDNGQYPHQNPAFANNRQLNNGVGFLPGIRAPWIFPGQRTLTTSACEVHIAPISKRVYAELLDFAFLYLTKVLVLSIYYDDLERYNELQYMLMTDDAASLKVIEELLVQALVYRLMVFAFEVVFLMGGLNGSIGGATPGKYLMGLSAVASDSITTVSIDAAGEKVRIVPGGNLGFWRAFLRALVKNFSMTFLFPVFLTVLFFQHNRTIYDVISNSTIVITSTTQQRPQGNQNGQR